MPKKIIVWGVGWLGLPLVSQLLKENHHVVCLTRNISKKNDLINKGIECLSIDELVKNQSILKTCDSFILTVPPVNDSFFFETLLLILESLPKDAHFIYTSSIGIYQDINGEVDEDSVLDSTSKVYQTEQFLQLNKSENLTILRLGGLIGPKRHPIHYLIKNPTNVSPLQVVNLIQQQDVNEIICFLIKTKFLGVYNVCSPLHPTRKDYYSKAAEALDLGNVIFETNSSQTGKIVKSKKIETILPTFDFSSIYDFEKCK